jgi:adenylosuccinate lyase
MSIDSILAISPLDGRYQKKIEPLQTVTSEFGLIKYRVYSEICWLQHLVEKKIIGINLSESANITLENIKTDFNIKDAHEIKDIEQTTRHDVKAVEYFIQNAIQGDEQLKPLIPFIHFACTSEDINSTAYALMLQDARELLLTHINAVIETLNQMAIDTAATPMLARTHGQTASPTTLGKELKVFVMRLRKQVTAIQQVPNVAKFSGAVGNYNAHISAFKDVNWPATCEEFITSLGLEFNHHTTQIEPHDHFAACMHNLIRINNILIDTCRDIWQYISLNYFSQKKLDHEIGSSTMPHKINPIDFENAEGNLGMANAIAQHLANKLPISRLQRDLSDSTVLRNTGVVFGHSILAYQSFINGFKRLAVNHQQIQQDLADRWEVLAEPIQTVLRKNGITDAYEQLKTLTRGSQITQASIMQFINACQLSDEDKQTLLALTPENYIGLAAQIAMKD